MQSCENRGTLHRVQFTQVDFWRSVVKAVRKKAPRRQGSADKRHAIAGATRGRVGTNRLVIEVRRLVREGRLFNAENARLRTENENLRGALAEIERALGEPAARRRGRPPKGLSQPRPVRSETGKPQKRARRARRRITDPLVLEKKRAALEKARGVLAEKRRAARAA